MAREKGRPSLIVRLSDWASDPTLQLTETASRQARLCFLDTLACILSGADQPVVRSAVDAVIRSGGTGQAISVAGTERFSATAAAFVNGTAAHVLDFDDYEIPASTHPSATIIPALLALNDLSPAPLHQLLTAYLAGYETIVRVGQALGGYGHYLAGWHATSTVGSFGATAAAAKFLGLEAARFANALGLTCSMASGLKAQFGTDAKPLHAGFAARTGVEAALLAQAGATANPEALEADCGFLPLYGGTDINHAVTISEGPCAMDAHPALRKPWPSCAYTHRAIEAALNHTARHGFETSRITRGTIRIPEPFFRVSPFLGPQTPSQARFSVLYCVGAALHDKSLTPESFSDKAIKRASVQDMMSRIRVEAYDVHTRIEDMSPDHPDSLTLEFSDGGTHTETIAHVKGGPTNPLSEVDICEKFTLCGGSPSLIESLLNADDEDFVNFWPGASAV